MVDGQQGTSEMRIIDQSAEYYRLREGHERALALAARTCEQRHQHLRAAARYAELARGSIEACRRTGS
jgi:hypothetical protein